MQDFAFKLKTRRKNRRNRVPIAAPSETNEKSHH